MDVREWLGEDNKIGIDIWEHKYRYDNETFDQWLFRITDGNDKYKQLILIKESGAQSIDTQCSAGMCVLPKGSTLGCLND